MKATSSTSKAQTIPISAARTERLAVSLQSPRTGSVLGNAEVLFSVVSGRRPCSARMSPVVRRLASKAALRFAEALERACRCSSPRHRPRPEDSSRHASSVPLKDGPEEDSPPFPSPGASFGGRGGSLPPVRCVREAPGSSHPAVSPTGSAVSPPGWSSEPPPSVGGLGAGLRGPAPGAGASPAGSASAVRGGEPDHSDSFSCPGLPRASRAGP